LQHGSHCVVDAVGLAGEWKRMVAAGRGSLLCSKAEQMLAYLNALQRGGPGAWLDHHSVRVKSRHVPALFSLLLFAQLGRIVKAEWSLKYPFTSD
jgi:hypothetical protein